MYERDDLYYPKSNPFKAHMSMLRAVIARDFSTKLKKKGRARASLGAVLRDKWLDDDLLEDWDDPDLKLVYPGQSIDDLICAAAGEALRLHPCNIFGISWAIYEASVGHDEVRPLCELADLLVRLTACASTSASSTTRSPLWEGARLCGTAVLSLTCGRPHAAGASENMESQWWMLAGVGARWNVSMVTLGGGLTPS